MIFVTTVGMDILAHKIVHELWIGGDGARNYSSTMQKNIVLLDYIIFYEIIGLLGFNYWDHMSLLKNALLLPKG